VHDAWRYGRPGRPPVPFEELHLIDKFRKKRGNKEVPLPRECAIPKCSRVAHQWCRWQSQSIALCSMHCQRVYHSPDNLFNPHPLRRHNGAGYISRGYRMFSRNGKKLAEHRYVMEQTLGRPLRSDEHVHHRNGDKLDNRPKNLMVLSNAEHKLLHYRYGWSLHEFSLDALKQLRANLDSLIAKVESH
jgi:hypothetical protein